MKKHLEDSEIINQFSQGGVHAEQAFNAVVTQFGPQLYSQIRRIVGNHDQTNDVLQNVFIKVFKNLHDFHNDSTIYTWIYRIAHNESLNFLAKEKRRAGIDFDSPIVEIQGGHAQLDTLDSGQISELLLRAIETLPEKQAIVFQLKYFDEMQYNEMSTRLGTSEGALKASFHHAKQKIEKFILSQLNQ